MTITDGATGTLEGIGLQDHSIGSEYRIFGPPGTGKTTSLGDVIKRDARKYGPDALLVTSFSRTAATELVNCQLPINPDRVGTLHSHCFTALGSPAIAEVHAREWNRTNPALALTPIKDQRRLHGEEGIGDEDITPTGGGDALLQAVNRYRGLMVEPMYWPARVREFESKWLKYKRATGLLDFCDLIETCLNDVLLAPGNPSVIFADEAQDLNRMQLNLLRKWGQRADYFVLAFDDDQTIFTFVGASPDAILDPELPESHKVILSQSHRVPRAVHRLADGLIRQVTRRQSKVYRPRPEEGRVVRFSAGGYKSPEYFILSTATKHLEQGKTIMFLASSSYMLQPLLRVLRKNGIPFHNPYRKANGFWNPLRLGSRGSAARRILSLLRPHPGWAGRQREWERHELLSWTEWLAPKGILQEGTRARISARLMAPASIEFLADIFESDALESLLQAYAHGYPAMLHWWRARLAPEFQRRASFPSDVAMRRGATGLVDDPSVVVGSIHSVKGAQADVVYLFPDLSKAADAQYQQHGPARDSVIRVFYVGATRARETLYICSRESAMAVSL
jgi:DNA helicase-2/ATP-dependent DNA helicase PcrA